MIYLSLFLSFIKVGLFGFGGGIAMLPLIYQEAKTLSGMTQAEFSDLVGLSQMTPGPIAVNAATYVGYVTSGIPGSLVATISVAVPSFVLVVLTSYYMTKFKESGTVQGALSGIRPMAAGLVASAGIMMCSQSVTLDGSPEMFASLAITLVSIILIARAKISPIIVMILSGIIGAVIFS